MKRHFSDGVESDCVLQIQILLHHTHFLHGCREIRGYDNVIQHFDIYNLQGGFQLSRNRYIAC